MAGTAAKVFGVLFLVLGILAAGVGLTAMLFVDADERDRQADEGGFLGFLGQNEDREDRNRAVGAGGVGLFTIGLLLAMLGLFLVALGFQPAGPADAAGQRSAARSGEDAGGDFEPDEPASGSRSSEAADAQSWAVPAAIIFGSILMLLMFWYATG